jgi:hypothetical protein
MSTDTTPQGGLHSSLSREHTLRPNEAIATRLSYTTVEDHPGVEPGTLNPHGRRRSIKTALVPRRAHVNQEN